MINDPKRRIADVVLDELAREFREHIEKQEEEQREIVARLDALSGQICKLTELWQQARGVATFMRWLVGVVTAIAATWAWLSDHVKLH